MTATATAGGEDDEVRVVRLTVNLSPETADALRASAALRGVTLTEALVLAIGSLAYLDGAHTRGATVREVPGRSVAETVTDLDG